MKYHLLLREDNLKKYENHLRQEEKSKATIEKYLRDVRHLIGFLSDKGTINKDIMITYKNHLIKSYAVSSANTMLTSINNYLGFMKMPDLKVKLFKIQRKVFCGEDQELTKSEYMRLLKTSDKDETRRIHLIMQTICSTGIRIGELQYFTIEAIKKRKIEVYNKGKCRIIFIPRKLCEKLSEYAAVRGIKEGCIFITRNNRPVNRSNIWAEMKKLCMEADVDVGKVYPHNLRHLFARTYYQTEKDIIKLADIMGHSSIDTTRVYTVSTGKEHEKQISCLKLLI